MPLFGELRRRNIFKVSLAYVVAGWLFVQLAAMVAPDRFVRLFTLVVILGFPVMVLFAWAYELTPEGLKSSADVDKTQSITVDTGRRLNYLVLALLLIAAAVAILRFAIG
jgi:hypothetical protein